MTEDETRYRRLWGALSLWEQGKGAPYQPGNDPAIEERVKLLEWGREQASAWRAIGWDPARWLLRAWCGAWVVRAEAEGGLRPLRGFAFRHASSVARRAGKGPAGQYPGATIGPVDKGPGDLPGCVLLVRPTRARPLGTHVTIAVGLEAGAVVCVGGNQRGGGRYGESVRSGVAVTPYPLADVAYVANPPLNAFEPLPVSAAPSPKDVATLQAAAMAAADLWLQARGR